jgi:PhzF family phenazine biosynthesis protein
VVGVAGPDSCRTAGLVTNVDAMQRRFEQVDVFSAEAYRGNPLAVVVDGDGDGLTDAEMQRFANWTNLSETTFLLPPTHPDADYRVRIFTASHEMPFAGHPTLGSCHTWLRSSGDPKNENEVVQECGVGLVRVRRSGERLAFAAPPLVKSGPVNEVTKLQLADTLNLASADIVAAEWIDNGPGWVGVLLADATAVSAVLPKTQSRLKIGVVGPYPEGSAIAFEVRGFFPSGAGVLFEDPVTGSLNASLAQWLIGSDRAPSSYVAQQGTSIGRAGRIYVDRIDADFWIGGNTTTCIAGMVEL